MRITNTDCASVEPHDPHTTTGTVTFTCEGKTECGERSHEPHRVELPGEFKCMGICGCGLYRFLHNVSAHK